MGTHAQHLGAYVSGLDLEAVLAELATTVPGRASDDYAALLLHWAGGALGTLWVTNAAAGAEHRLSIRIFGAEGGLEWQQGSQSSAAPAAAASPGCRPAACMALDPLAEHATRLEDRPSRGLSGGFRQPLPGRRRCRGRAAYRKGRRATCPRLPDSA
ncbi:MAG: Gfo/Idh/MocA family oxidoreductase [Geminicoccaceae bacterium]